MDDMTSEYIRVTECLRGEIEKQHAMILWLAKRLARDITCHRCPAKNTTCNNGYPYKIKKVCSALLIEAAEKAVQDVD
jgi:hypothetical protein